MIFPRSCLSATHNKYLPGKAHDKKGQCGKSRRLWATQSCRQQRKLLKSYYICNTITKNARDDTKWPCSPVGVRHPGRILKATITSNQKLNSGKCCPPAQRSLTDSQHSIHKRHLLTIMGRSWDLQTCCNHIPSLTKAGQIIRYARDPTPPHVHERMQHYTTRTWLCPRPLLSCASAASYLRRLGAAFLREAPWNGELVQNNLRSASDTYPGTNVSLGIKVSAKLDSREDEHIANSIPTP